MSSFDDSLRGYSFKIHRRDNFICQYCGIDGRQSFDSWLTLTSDHLLPKGHPGRDNPEYIVTACSFCNTADNRYFDHAKELGLVFDGKTRAELVAQRKPFVEAVRHKYREFWEKEVVHPSPDN